MLLRGGPVGFVVERTAIGAGGVGFDFWVGQIGTVSAAVPDRCDVSSELCFSGAKLQRWISPLITRFGVLPRR